MVKLKEVPRTATFAWAPTVQDPLLVTGTVAGAIDADFSSTTQLEFWNLAFDDHSSEGFQVTPVKSIDTSARFYDIAWGAVSNAKPKGVVAGGLENGSLEIWDADKVLSGETSPLQSSQQHSAAIKAVQFNPIQSHLLATAGAKGEIFVWDLNKMSSPYAPGTQSKRLDEIEAVAWNNNVAHIVATGGNTGFTSVWDLKSKREVLHLHYSGSASSTRSPVSSVAWHPDNSTKLVTASVDDHSPVVLLWDLRNANAPERILQGHDQGILSLDWCKQDSSLLLSSGKDNRTILFNPDTAEKIGEYPIATNWAFKTRFNPVNPDLLATASFDGTISVQTLQDTSVATKPATAKPEGDEFWNSASYVDSQRPTLSLKHAPKWLRCPASANFGFGGKIASVRTVDGKSTVSISTFVGDESINEDTKRLAQSLQEGNLASVAEEKVKSASNESDKYDWEVISALLTEGGSKKDKLAKFYGLEDAENKKASKEDGKKEVKEDTKEGEKSEESNDIFGGDGKDDDFLKSLSSGKKEEETPEFVPQGPFQLVSDSKDSVETKITRALLNGRITDAVDICIKEDRLDDALILALNGDDESKRRVQNVYLAKHASAKPFIRLLTSVNKKKLDDVVDNADVSQWQDIIVGLFTYSSSDTEFSELCGRLGDRLLAKRNDIKNKTSAKAMELRNSAVLCFVAGANLEKASAIWLQEVSDNENAILRGDGDSKATPYVAHVKALHSFIEKVTVFQKATGTTPSGSPDKLDHLFDAYRDYANIVASQGHLELAEKYLNLLPAQTPGLSIEKDRVQKASSRASTPARAIPGAASKSAATAGQRPAYSTSGAAAKNTSIYAPVQMNAPAPTAAALSGSAGMGMYGQPVKSPAQQPVVPQPQQQGTSGFAPVSSSPYAPVNPYQPPQAPMPRGTSPFTNAGPPPMNNAGSALPPPPAKKDVGGWNDLPASAISATAPRRANSSTSTPIQTPFGNQTSQFAPPPPAGVAPPVVRQTPPPQPPPPSAEAKPPLPRGSTPSQSGSPSLASQPPLAAASSRYAPQPSGSPAQPPAALGQPPVNAPMNPYGAPPQSAAAPPNPYAPPQSGPAAGMSPGSASPVNPYAPPPGSQQGPRPGSANLYAPPSGGIAPPPKSPMVYGGAQVAPPPPGPTVIDSAPPAPEPAPVKAEPEPPAAPKYPPGDRSHIPEKSQPIYRLLSQEIERVKPAIPEMYKRQVKDAEKRLNILFDHLNNEDLLSDATIKDMAELAEAVQARNYDVAQQLHVEILTTRSEECGQWMVGVKRLIEMSRAVE
uniref:Protein transport protein SEC31 n=1 Tax=Blastobotrys adeninivorans TaxID=409370 RepID=A0A060TIW1_BLAAD